MTTHNNEDERGEQGQEQGEQSDIVLGDLTAGDLTFLTVAPSTEKQEA